MANTIILKKSAVADKVPLPGDLAFGEVALNYADGKIYYKNTATTIDFIGNGGTFTNKLIITDTTQSTSTTTGALQVAGGVGIGGNLYIDGVVRIQNTSSNTTSDTGALVVTGGAGFTGNIHVQGYGHFGLEPTVAYAYPMGIFTGDYNGYTQIGIQNINAGTSASGDVVITTDDGTDATNYIDLGINNSQYSDGGWTVSGARDGYLYVNSNNLTVGVDTPGKTVAIHVGGTQASDIVAVFRDPGLASTGSDSGSFTVNGGVGFNSDVYIGETLHVGANHLTTLPDSLMIGTADVDSYTQVNIRNINSGFSASADFVATADDGTDVSNYIDLGINNSNYSNVDWTVSGAHDGYLYVNSGNLTIGTDSTGTTVKVHVGGVLAENIVATFGEPNTESTSTVNGALIVTGGVGVSGNLYVGGEIVAQKLTIEYTTVTTILVETDDIIKTSNNTQSTSTITGALQVAGGAGIGGDLYVGGTVYSSGVALQNFNTSTLVAQAITAQTATTATAAAIAYSLADTATIYVYRATLADTATTSTNAATAYALANTSTTFVGRAAIASSATNLSGGAAGSIPYQSAENTTLFVPIGTSTFVLQSNGGVPTWVSTASLGISGGSGGGAVTSIIAGTDTAVSGATGAVTIWNTSTLQTITNRGATTNQAISITNTSSSISTTTGALVVSGGVGIGGTLNVGGDLIVTGAIFGSVSTATSAAIAYSLANTSTTFVGRAALADSASKWTTARTITLAGDLTGNVSIDGSTNVTLTATIAADSISLGTDTTGIYVASGDVSGFGLSGSSSTEGGTFTVTSNATSTNANSTLVFRDSLGNFGAGTITAQAISITNTTSATSTTTGALQVSGGIGIAGNTHIGGNIVVKDTAIVGDSSTTSVLTSVVSLDTFSASVYRSAQYIVSISNSGLGEYQTSDVLIVHNGTTSFVQSTSVFTGNKALLNFSTTISGGNVSLQGTGSGTGANPNIVKIQKTYITI